MIKELYRGRYSRMIEVEDDMNGKKTLFEIAERSPGVRLLFINEDKQILLAKEWRREMEGWDYRLPGGKLFDKVSEYVEFLENGWDINKKAKEIAIAEWKQETGIIVKDMKIMKIDHVGSTVNWDLFYILVTDYDDSILEQELHWAEDITIGRYDYKQVLDIMKTDKMQEWRSKGFLYDYILTHYDL